MEKKLGFQKVPELVLCDNVVKIYTLLGFKKNRRHQRTSTLSSDRIARVKLGQ